MNGVVYQFGKFKGWDVAIFTPLYDGSADSLNNLISLWVYLHREVIGDNGNGLINDTKCLSLPFS